MLVTLGCVHGLHFLTVLCPLSTNQVLEYFREQVEIGAQKEAEWNELFARYKESYPELVCEMAGHV